MGLKLSKGIIIYFEFYCISLSWILKHNTELILIIYLVKARLVQEGKPKGVQPENTIQTYP